MSYLVTCLCNIIFAYRSKYYFVNDVILVFFVYGMPTMFCIIERGHIQFINTPNFQRHCLFFVQAMCNN